MDRHLRLTDDNAAPITAMTSRGRHVARAGFSSMLDSAKMPVETGIFLTEPYDPNKAIVLLVPGLQSTPFAFADLVKAMRRDPEVSAHFQVWTFLYGTGTPVLFNALQLRQELEKTIRNLDPGDRDFATRHIVVLGHSMGGLRRTPWSARAASSCGTRCSWCRRSDCTVTGQAFADSLTDCISAATRVSFAPSSSRLHIAAAIWQRAGSVTLRHRSFIYRRVCRLTSSASCRRIRMPPLRPHRLSIAR